MKTVIRKARAEDQSTIQNLNHKLFLQELSLDPNLNTKWPYQEAGEEYFRKRIAGELGVCFVAEHDSVVVGYVAGKVNEEMDLRETILRGELENIYVEEDVRGMGIGKLLTQELLHWCQENGAKSIVVSAYYGNESAIDFYKYCGFRTYAITLEKDL